MKELWKPSPSVLKRQVLRRLSIGLLFLVIGIISWILSKRFIFALPCFIAMAVFCISGIGVLFLMLNSGYIVLSGVCEQIEQTPIMRRTKALYLATEYGCVKIPIRRNMRKVQIGASVRCYMSYKASVYDYDGLKTVSDYIAIEIFQ